MMKMGWPAMGLAPDGDSALTATWIAALVPKGSAEVLAEIEPIPSTAIRRDITTKV
jgi:hypothetical protein